MSVTNGYVRDRYCMNCHHEWTSPVVLAAATANISGEETCFCPRCHSRGVTSAPAYRPEDEVEPIPSGIGFNEAAFDAIFGKGGGK
jgi:hypothetical protein